MYGHVNLGSSLQRHEDSLAILRYHWSNWGGETAGHIGLDHEHSLPFLESETLHCPAQAPKDVSGTMSPHAGILEKSRSRHVWYVLYGSLCVRISKDLPSGRDGRYRRRLSVGMNQQKKQEMAAIKAYQRERHTTRMRFFDRLVRSCTMDQI